MTSPVPPDYPPWFINEGEGTPPDSAVFYATLLRLPLVVASLLRSGEDVDGRGSWRFRNALQAASGHGNKEMVQLLLDSGANVNVKCGLFGNALQCASLREGNKEIVQLLLDKGADVNAEGGAWGNALNAAAAAGGHASKKEIIQLLLDNGANDTEGKYHGILQAASAGDHEAVP